MSDSQVLIAAQAMIDDLLKQLASAKDEIQILRGAFLKIRASSWPKIKGGCWCKNPKAMSHTLGCTALRAAFEELPDEEWGFYG